MKARIVDYLVERGYAVIRDTYNIIVLELDDRRIYVSQTRVCFREFAPRLTHPVTNAIIKIDPSDPLGVYEQIDNELLIISMDAI